VLTPLNVKVQFQNVVMTLSLSLIVSSPWPTMELHSFSPASIKQCLMLEATQTLADGLQLALRAHKQMQIKLHKFNGTGSCASYNRRTSRDKLAFLKGALTGNAAQVHVHAFVSSRLDYCNSMFAGVSGQLLHRSDTECHCGLSQKT